MTAPYGPDSAANQQYWRERAKTDSERFGFKEGELQMLWRGPGCFARKYDTGEVVAAICDALTREGQTAWPGDGTSCVEQMVRLQWERAEKAEAELAELRSSALTRDEAMYAAREFENNPHEIDGGFKYEIWESALAKLCSRSKIK
jgi:hypothetical protein